MQSEDQPKVVLVSAGIMLFAATAITVLRHRLSLKMNGRWLLLQLINLLLPQHSKGMLMIFLA